MRVACVESLRALDLADCGAMLDLHRIADSFSSTRE